jgi:hypothetical protein
MKKSFISAMLDTIEQRTDAMTMRLNELCAEDLTECDCGETLIVTTTPEGDETVKRCPDGCIEVSILHAW